MLPILIMAPSVLAGGGVPPIHDITTDTADPPTFGAVLPLRVDAPNDVEYGQPDLTAAEMANLQRQAYPAVKTLRSDLPAEGALDRAEAVLREQGVNGQVEMAAAFDLPLLHTLHKHVYVFVEVL